MTGDFHQVSGFAGKIGGTETTVKPSCSAYLFRTTFPGCCREFLLLSK
jgi:hypothetical protein